MFGVIRGERLPPRAAGLVVFADPTPMYAGASDLGGRPEIEPMLSFGATTRCEVGRTAYSAGQRTREPQCCPVRAHLASENPPRKEEGSNDWN
jgi:hypothetical protein